MQWVWDGTQERAFLTSFQVTLLQAPPCERQCSGLGTFPAAVSTGPLLWPWLRLVFSHH